MTECWSEGELRAYVDRELPPGDMDRVAAHLPQCARCEARLKEVAGRAERIALWMEALPEVEAAQPGAVPALRGRRWIGPAVAAAAVVAVAVWFAPKRPAGKPAASGMRVRVSQPRPIPAQAAPMQEAPSEPAPKRTPRQKARPRPEYFVALDDEPLESGVIMRVALGSDQVQADVIYDQNGRPRAIRPVVNSK